jgi:hypothetical protein
MIGGVIRDLERCRTEREFWRIQTKAETKLTPIEIEELVSKMHALPNGARPWLTQLSELMRHAGGRPQRYRRRIVSADVNHFADQTVPVSGKALIIGFSGNADRLMLPIGCVLQFLPSRRFDVVVLRDTQHAHYLNGVGDYAPTLNGLAERLRADFKPKRYDRVYCFGTSMGGFGALRCGVLIKADRAISVGGRYHWHIRRLLGENEIALSAFDPLCDCFVRSRTELVCAYSEGNNEDRVDADRLAAILPVGRIAFPEASHHNLIAVLLKANRLKPFFDEIFDLGGSERRPMAVG